MVLVELLSLIIRIFQPVVIMVKVNFIWGLRNSYAFKLFY